MRKTPYRIAAAALLASAALPALAQPVESYAPIQSHQAVAKGRKVISEGERAAASIAIQNLMSRHEYYHAAGRNLEEIDSFWVSANGRYAGTATFASPDWVMYGLQTVRNAYGMKSRSDAQAGLANLRKLDPSVQDVPASYGAGAEWVMHTSTTPVIEIAGDGKTAQGAWYSPGAGILPIFKDGKIKLQSMFFWEKYGGDFVKEDGVWKIWHLQMAYDFVPTFPESMLDQLNGQLGSLALREPLKPVAGEAGERMEGPLPPGFKKPKFSYKPYSVQRGSVIWPNLPRPYYTFSESAYTNCNCDQDLPK